MTESEKGGAAMTGTRQKARSLSILQKCCFAVYVLTVLWFTIGRRQIGYYPEQLDFFGSYRAWLRGDWLSGSGDLANIAMFVPFGFLLEELFRGKKRFILIVVLGALFSLLVETVQFMLMRGYFELDDVFNNALGALLGAVLYRLLRHILPEKGLRGMLYFANCAVLLFCAGLFLLLRGSVLDASSPLPMGVCFQVDQAVCEDGSAELSGFCFWYEQDHPRYSLLLESGETGQLIPLKTESGLERKDVSAYFHRENLHPGFHAAGQGIAPGEYEIILDFGLYRRIPTGVYLTAGAAPGERIIHDLPAEQQPQLSGAGPDLEKILAEGDLKASHPDQHIYVYWYAGSLYWIAEEGFRWEADGTTRLELVLWSAQKELLSEKSRTEGKDFDTVVIDFEPCELTGDFGAYRAAAWKAEAPYPISMLRTGVWADGGWLWQDHIRPHYDL